MSAIDQRRFLDAVDKAKWRMGPKSVGTLDFGRDNRYAFTPEWTSALHVLAGLAIFDMLPALDAVTAEDRRWLAEFDQYTNAIGNVSARRISSAYTVVQDREIADFKILSDGELNDCRAFLGCTPLDDAGVQKEIESAINEAKAKYRIVNPCCGAVKAAWDSVLVNKRRAYAGAAHVSNLAAASHYMLARYHVCAAKAMQSQMNVVIDVYDAKKRLVIANGDKALRSMELTKGNSPFPPDYAIRNWAYKGSADGDADRLRCNASETRPPVPLDIDGSEA